jgi:hypothetical protein
MWYMCVHVCKKCASTYMWYMCVHVCSKCASTYMWYMCVHVCSKCTSTYMCTCVYMKRVIMQVDLSLAWGEIKIA